MRILVVSLEGVVDDEAGERDVLMPVSDEESIEVTANLCFRTMRLKSASHDRAECSDNAVTALSTQTITMSEEIAVTKYIESAVCSFGY